MVLLGPVQIHLARAHGIKSAIHADRPDIDMRQDRRDHQHRQQAMDDVAKLHPFHPGEEEGEDQQIARNRHCRAAQHGDPEDHLLPTIEAASFGMLMADQPATRLEPGDVACIRDIILNPDQQHDHEAQREGEGQEDCAAP